MIHGFTTVFRPVKSCLCRSKTIDTLDLSFQLQCFFLMQLRPRPTIEKYYEPYYGHDLAQLIDVHDHLRSQNKSIVRCFVVVHCKKRSRTEHLTRTRSL